MTDRDTSSIESLVMLPVVITQVDETYGCVVCMTRDGRLFRPEPVMLEDIAGPSAYFRFGEAVHCRLGPSLASDARPEDRDWLARLPVEGEVAEWRGDALDAWFAGHLDRSAQTVFEGERSVGLIRARPEIVKLIRSTRGRFLIVLGFTDDDGQYHEWIVPDLPFSKAMTAILKDAPDAERIAGEIVERLRQTSFYLALVLSKPRQNSLGSIRGCQPLVGGVHSFPAYADILADHATAMAPEEEAAASV
jgi:hypothetical protein